MARLVEVPHDLLCYLAGLCQGLPRSCPFLGGFQGVEHDGLIHLFLWCLGGTYSKPCMLPCFFVWSIQVTCWIIHRIHPIIVFFGGFDCVWVRDRFDTNHRFALPLACCFFALSMGWISRRFGVYPRLTGGVVGWGTSFLTKKNKNIQTPSILCRCVKKKQCFLRITLTVYCFFLKNGCMPMIVFLHCQSPARNAMEVTE